jgi:hypothetical protein
MKKYNIKKLTLSNYMSFLCFFASATFTIALMQSQGYEFWAKLVFCIYAIPTEMGKYYFSHEIFYGKRMGWRVYCAILALMLFGISITASLVFSVNQANKQENSMKKNSIEYKQAQKDLEGKEAREKAIELKGNKDKTIETINKQITDLENSKTAAVNDLVKTRDSYPKSYLDVKAKLNTEINNKRSEYDQQIKNKRDELLKVQGQEIVVNEENKKDLSTLNLKVEDGMSSVFGTEENKKTVFFIFSLVLELTGIGFYIDAKKKANSTTPPLQEFEPDSLKDSSSNNKTDLEAENFNSLIFDEDKKTKKASLEIKEEKIEPKKLENTIPSFTSTEIITQEEFLPIKQKITKEKTVKELTNTLNKKVIEYLEFERENGNKKLPGQRKLSGILAVPEREVGKVYDFFEGQGKLERKSNGTFWK